MNTDRKNHNASEQSLSKSESNMRIFIIESIHLIIGFDCVTTDIGSWHPDRRSGRFGRFERFRTFPGWQNCSTAHHTYCHWCCHFSDRIAGLLRSNTRIAHAIDIG